MKSGRNTSATIVLLTKYKYALSANRKWREHISRYHGAAHGIRITHPLRVKSGMNMSAMIVLLMKWEYSQSESQKWQGHVSHDCVTRKWREHVSRDHGEAQEMGLRTD